MDFDNSWKALLKPGEATNFFDVNNPQGFQVAASEYSKINAWWLAELSRLIYKEEGDEAGNKSKGSSRNHILEKVNLREVRFFDNDGTQCALIESQDAANDFTILVFRGTNELKDWLANVCIVPAKWPKGGFVHTGFKNALEKIWGAVNEHLSSINSPIFYTGHSLGSALATLAAAKRPPRAVYTFASPRVGNNEFVRTLTDIKIYRVVNNRDIVTTTPPSVWPFNYRHVGELHYIAHDARMMINPTEQTVTAARQKTERSLENAADYRRWFDPPEFLSDHAPVNYVAHLERQVFQGL